MRIINSSRVNQPGDWSFVGARASQGVSLSISESVKNADEVVLRVRFDERFVYLPKDASIIFIVEDESRYL